MNQINRREALRRTAFIMGGTLMAPTITGILNGCSAKPGLTWSPAFFDENQARLLTILSDIIIPRTDTPSASELGVPAYIDDMVGQVYSEEMRAKFREALDAFDQACQTDKGEAFHELDAASQEAYVQTLHAELQQAGTAPGAEKPFLMWAKELVVSGYFTTEVGMTQVLQYQAIPTRYDGCLPLEEAGNGKTWAT
ncbi:MAG: gluconate 2-dehydrogenase subunit 3 family protein [Cyclobacteriaceae bacterium]|nr:gluconate 2-dehydrogenase subunit 3 family protein [Cyclobacteriaceae bacterium]